MPGVDKGQRDSIRDQHRPVIADGHKLAHAALGIRHGVAGLQQRQLFILAVAVQPVDVAFVDVRRIWQHDAAQVPRGGCGEDVAGKAALAQVGQVSAVVDVRVGEHHHIDLRRIKGEVAVALKGLLPSPLVQAAVQQDALAVHSDEMFRARGGACGTAESQFHGWLGRAGWLAGPYFV